jgi:hypothetical protein
MKFFFVTVVALLSVIGQSCKKTHPSTGGESLSSERKIRFQLYTDKDFSNENSVIKFSIFIRDAHTTLFDSSLAPMKLQDIPDAAHKIVIDKMVLGDNNADLAAGFHYEIQNVGHSGYIDTSRAGNEFKVVDYAFH